MNVFDVMLCMNMQNSSLHTGNIRTTPLFKGLSSQHGKLERHGLHVCTSAGSPHEAFKHIDHIDADLGDHVAALHRQHHQQAGARQALAQAQVVVGAQVNGQIRLTGPSRAR